MKKEKKKKEYVKFLHVKMSAFQSN